MTYKIVADSSANVLELPGADFTSVPLKIVTKDKEYVDDAGLDVEAMVAEIRDTRGRSSTACRPFAGGDRLVIRAGTPSSMPANSIRQAPLSGSACLSEHSAQ